MLPNLVTQVETIHHIYSHYPARNDGHSQDVRKSNHIIITNLSIVSVIHLYTWCLRIE